VPVETELIDDVTFGRRRLVTTSRLVCFDTDRFPSVKCSYVYCLQ